MPKWTVHVTETVTYAAVVDAETQAEAEEKGMLAVTEAPLALGDSRVSLFEVGDREVTGCGEHKGGTR